MRIIRQIIPRKIEVWYQCKICKTKYRSPEQALACEARPLESKVFSVGDFVAVKEKRPCTCGRQYTLHGQVVKKLGPQVPDDEYEVKWIQIPGRRGQHVFMYQVEGLCPHCKEKRSTHCYGPEISKKRKR